MRYIDVFGAVAKYMRSKKLAVEFEQGSPVTSAMIDAARQSSSVSLPEPLLEFYRDVGDGLLFRWEGEQGECGKVEIITLQETVNLNERERPHAIEFDKEYQYPFVDDPILAKVTAGAMQKWFAFHWEGNGDSFCLDGDAVVFNQHDWFDGGTGFNGFRMGETLWDFFHDWSQVCFQRPSSLWWPSVLSPAGVNWESEQFRKAFRLSSFER